MLASLHGENSQMNVTVAFVPRETVSRTLDSLEAIVRHTATPHDLVIVIACYPPALRAELRKRGKELGAIIVELPGFATPNEARNAALAAVQTRYVAFVDNDIDVRDDWLGPLVECAVENEATIVSPLVFELYPPFTRIHMAGGEARLIRPRRGTFSTKEKHLHAHQAETGEMSLAAPYTTELVEFHAVLVDAEWLRSCGGLDPELCCVAEHWDMSLQAGKQGRKVMVNPASRVNYSPPRNVTDDDIRFFEIRWSRAWFVRGAQRLRAKYNVRRGAAYRGWVWVVDHRAHPIVPALQRRWPKMSAKTARSLAMRFIIPWSDLFPSRRLREDLAAWQATRGPA